MKQSILAFGFLLLRGFCYQAIIGTMLIAALPRQKILIMTPTSNHPEFIAWQAQCFKKFLKDDYEFIVFNDGHNEHDMQAINAMCASLKIACISVPQENRGRVKRYYYSRATYLHGEAIKYMMQTVGFDYNGIVVLIDSDMFLVKNFSVIDFLKEHDIAGVRQGPYQGEKEYMWPGLMFFNMATLPNKSTMQLHSEKDLDTGGAIYHYFAENPTVKKLFFPQRARFRLSPTRQPLYCNVSPIKHEYIPCSLDCTIAAETVCSNALHTPAILKQFEFSEAMINRIECKQVPAPSEFLIGDTFFHLMAGSGYQDKRIGNEIITQRTKLLHAFMNDILGT
jgi:hypothetical protein